MKIDKGYSLENILLFIFAIFAILGYTELPLKANIVKPLVQLMFILITIKNINFRNYTWLIPLLLIIVIWPLLAIIFGIYNYSVFQTLAYIAVFLLMLLFVISISSTYKDNVKDIITVWYYALNVSFLILFLLYKGISLNLTYLLHATFSNDRYGSNKLIQRYAMGFTNINTFALFASILLLCAFYQLLHNKNIILSLIDTAVGIIFILNSESRSPIVVISFLALIYIILSIKNKGIRFTLVSVMSLLIFSYSVVFVYLMLSANKISYLYNTIDSFSSFRLSFGSEAIDTLSRYGSLMFGIGPMSTTYITDNIFGKSITLDGSFQYYIFSMGVLGMLAMYFYFTYLYLKISKIKIDRKYAIIIMTFYFAYSLFENIFFIPNSTASIFCLSLIFTYLTMPVARRL